LVFGIGVTVAVVAPNQFMKEGNVSFIDKDSLKEPAKKTLINRIREDKINMTASFCSVGTMFASTGTYDIDENGMVIHTQSHY
jgi:hypothetical protein